MLEDLILSSLSSGVDNSIRRATVAAIDESGAVDVREGATHGSPLLRCDVLETSQTHALRFAVGDTVLIWAADATTGVVIGRIGRAAATAEATEPAPEAEMPDTLVIDAREQITLRVGDGSITIRADGKILIKGTDLVSHAKRMNRIKGGAVSIN